MNLKYRRRWRGLDLSGSGEGNLSDFCENDKEMQVIGGISE